LRPLPCRAPPSTKRPLKPTDDDSRESWPVKLVVRKVSEGDIRGAIRVLSSSDTLSSFTIDTRDALQKKHPPGSHLSIPSVPNVRPLTVTSEQVSRSISRFNQGSASGPDGLSPRHLKELTSHSLGKTSAKLLALTAVVNIILAGKVPAAIAPRLSYSALTSLLWIRRMTGCVPLQ